MKLLNSVLLITRSFVYGQGGLRGGIATLGDDFVDFTETLDSNESSDLLFGGPETYYDYDNYAGTGENAEGGRKRPNTEQLNAIAEGRDSGTRGMGGPIFVDGAAVNAADNAFDYYDESNYDTFVEYEEFNTVDSASSVSSGGRPGGASASEEEAGNESGRNYEANNPNDDGTHATRRCFTCSGESLLQCRDTGAFKNCGGDGIEDTRDYCLIEIRQNQFQNRLQNINMRCAEPADCHHVVNGNVQHAGANPTLHDNCRPKKDESGAATYHWNGRWRNHQSTCQTCIHMSSGLDAGSTGPGANQVFFETGANPSFLKLYRYNGASNDFVTDNQGEANMLSWSLDMWNSELNLAFNKQLQTPAATIASLW